MWNNHHFTAHFVTISPKSSSKSSTSGLAIALFNTANVVYYHAEFEFGFNQ
jgi:hypothetical protein